MRVYASSITEEQRTASGIANLAGTDREGFDEVKGLSATLSPSAHVAVCDYLAGNCSEA